MSSRFINLLQKDYHGSLLHSFTWAFTKTFDVNGNSCSWVNLDALLLIDLMQRWKRMSWNTGTGRKERLKKTFHIFQVFSHKLWEEKLGVVTLKISALVDLETPVAAVCGFIAQVTANDRCSHEEVRQWLAFFSFCEQPDFMLHMSGVCEQQDTAKTVGGHAEKLEECSPSPPHLTANCGCSVLHYDSNWPAVRKTQKMTVVCVFSDCTFGEI